MESVLNTGQTQSKKKLSKSQTESSENGDLCSYQTSVNIFRTHTNRSSTWQMSKHIYSMPKFCYIRCVDDCIRVVLQLWSWNISRSGHVIYSNCDNTLFDVCIRVTYLVYWSSSGDVYNVTSQSARTYVIFSKMSKLSKIFQIIKKISHLCRSCALT